MGWVEKRIKNLHWWDISCVKISVAGIVLAIAKLWPPLISLEWDWYVLIGVLAALPPLVSMFKGDFGGKV